METTELIAAVARAFVLPAYQERFIHEAANKPAKLMSRICHRIEEVFESRFSNGNCTYSESDGCLLFTLTGKRKVTTWDQAMKVVQQGGGGILIVDVSGKCFFAQAEGLPPSKQFAGNV